MSHGKSLSARLLDQAREGDTESLGLLLGKYFRYLNSLSVNHIDDRIRVRVTPSDVVQETLLEAHRDFHNFVGLSLPEFTGWLRKILFNNLAKAIESHLLAAKRDVRKQRSLDEITNDASHSTARLGDPMQSCYPTASAAMSQGEQLERMRNAINNLSADYRQVLHLRHFEGLSFSEIADQLGRNVGATRMLWVRAVEKLKNGMPQNE